jgi:hypothetical protein
MFYFRKRGGGGDKVLGQYLRTELRIAQPVLVTLLWEEVHTKAFLVTDLRS